MELVKREGPPGPRRREEIPDDALWQGNGRADDWQLDYDWLLKTLPAGRREVAAQAFRLGWSYGWAAREIQDREPTGGGLVVRVEYLDGAPDIAERARSPLVADDDPEAWQVVGNNAWFTWAELMRGEDDNPVVSWEVIYDPSQQVSDETASADQPRPVAKTEGDGDN